MTTFERRRQRSGRRDKLERVTIVVERDGLTRIYRNNVQQGWKPHRRGQAYALACQAAAFYSLTGGVEGFPEQPFI